MILTRFWDEKYLEWSKQVKKRDKACVICKNVTHLHSHHFKFNYSSHPDKRYDLSNGVTICQGCHDLYHEIWGKTDNNEEQFIQFWIFMLMIQKIAKESQEKENE